MDTKKVFKAFHFKAQTTWAGARRGSLSASGRPDIVVGSPPEFKGEGDVWAPEELLVGALNTCTLLTFLSLAGARGVTPVAYDSDADGLLEAVDGIYRMTEVVLRPRITLGQDADLEPARIAMGRVEAHCFIAKSLTARVTITPEFTVVSGAISGPTA